MQQPDDLNARIKAMMVEHLMLKISADEIQDDQPLFGAGLQLDSLDALQLVVALNKNFGLKIADPEQARSILASVNAMAAAVRQAQGAQS